MSRYHFCEVLLITVDQSWVCRHSVAEPPGASSAFDTDAFATLLELDRSSTTPAPGLYPFLGHSESLGTFDNLLLDPAGVLLSNGAHPISWDPLEWASIDSIDQTLYTTFGRRVLLVTLLQLTCLLVCWFSQLVLEHGHDRRR